MSVTPEPAPAGASEIGTASPAAVGARPADARLATKERLALLRHSKSFIAGSVIVGFWVLCAIFGELVVPDDPLATDPINDLLAPSADHWFGTDKLGRDVFSRVITGAREVLIVAPLATILATVVGTALGLVTGYFRGAVDDVLSRIIEAFLAIPVIIMGLLVAVALGPSKTTLILTIGILFAPVISRTVRAAVLTERELDYVPAARLRNERTPYILFGEILPNVTGPIVVEFTVRLGYAIFVAAGLSFLGFGIPPPAPDWGLQVAEHYGLISGGFWWPVLFPSLAIASLVIGVNLIADGVASAFERCHPLLQIARSRRPQPSRSASWTSPTACAASGDPSFAASPSQSPRASPTAWWASPAAANRPPRTQSCATCRATDASRAAR
jgi:peptide/nickel transport system permease protein